MNWFWSGFWPNLASTLVGIVVGVPIALWLNKLAGGATEKQRKADESERLRNGLQGIVAAFSHNRERLRVLEQTLQQNRAPFDVGLDTAEWEALKDEVVPFLKAPDLQRRIAFHFGRLGSFTRLSSLYLDHVAGVTSALGGVERTRDALRTHLLATCTELLAQIEQLNGEVQAITPATSA